MYICGYMVELYIICICVAYQYVRTYKHTYIRTCTVCIVLFVFQHTSTKTVLIRNVGTSSAQISLDASE